METLGKDLNAGYTEGGRSGQVRSGRQDKGADLNTQPRPGESTHLAAHLEGLSVELSWLTLM